MERNIRIVTHRNWIADEFKDFGAAQDFGLDINPDTALDTVWWASGYWVGRAYSTGIRIPVVSCGARWLAAQPFRWTRRKVLVDVRDRVVEFVTGLSGNSAHIKLPEFKSDDFESRVVLTSNIGEELNNALIGDTTLIQASEVISLRSEARFFVANRRVSAMSWYRVLGKTFGEDDFEHSLIAPSLADLISREMRSMYELAADVAANADAPLGYVVDIGVLNENGVNPVVIEANAAWSSNPYDADAAGVLESIKAAHDFDGTQRRWLFDPFQTEACFSPLRLSTS